MKTCPVCDSGFPDQHRTCPTDGAVLIESQELVPGSLVRGKYRIVHKLGQGGMGTVYLAEHLLLGGRVALKFLATELSRNPQFIKRFRNEARAAFQLRHPNIVEVMDLDQAEDGSLYIAMEFVEGPSLRAAIEQAPNGLNVDRALVLARGIASGLAAAHARGTVHRDIKPENILLLAAAGQAEQPKVLDFGIAAILEGATAVSQTRGLMLTPEYASPEQWRGTPAADLDGRTDLYALGCVLYQMLTGGTPFHAHNIEGWMYQHLQETPQPPSQLRAEVAAWPGLDALVMRLLAKIRDDRLQDGELLEVLESMLYASGHEEVLRQSGEPRQERPRTVIEEDWRRPEHFRTMPPATAPRTLPPQSGTQYPSAPLAQPAAPSPKPAPRKLPVWVWAAGAVLALATIGTAVHLFAPQPQAPQAQSPAGQPTSTQAAKDSDAQSSQPSMADEPKSMSVTEANPEPEKPTNSPPNKPAQNQTVKPPAARSVTPPSPVYEPTASELSQQAIEQYKQQHYAEASSLFEKACDGGGMEACKSLGNMYRFGNGVALDYPRAASLYTKACNGGNAKSCADLGFLYAKGSGVVQDDAHAAQLYTMACNGGDGLGCSDLGNVYASGRGVNKDQAQAAALYLKACGAGDGPGCSNLGNSYRIGRGVELDLTKARQFLDKGCKLGNQWGCDKLKEMQ